MATVSLASVPHHRFSALSPFLFLFKRIDQHKEMGFGFVGRTRKQGYGLWNALDIFFTGPGICWAVPQHQLNRSWSFFLSIKLSALVTTVRGENELVLLIKKEHTMSLNYKALESCPFNSVLKNDLLGESTLLNRH